MRVSKSILLIPVMLSILLLAGCGSDAGECNHDYGRWSIVTPATCTEDGVRSRTCDDCGAEEIKPLTASGHIEVITPAVEPTCAKGGLTEGKTCSVCSTVLAEQTPVPPSDHKYDPVITTAATCSQPGVMTYTCTFCSDAYDEEYKLFELDTAVIYEQSRPSIGQIVSYDRNGKALATGACFVYLSDGQILTSYHVIEDAYSAKITLDGKTYSVEYVLAYDKTIDLAIVQISGAFTALPICCETHAAKAEIYVADMGNPEFFKGTIKNPSKKQNGVTYIQHDVSVSDEYAGSPLIDQFGHVIGIVDPNAGSDLAISASEILNLTYGEKLTLAELHAQKHSAYDILRDYLIQSGDYDAETQEYTLSLGSYTNDYGEDYIRFAIYDEKAKEVRLGTRIEERTLCYIAIDSNIDGVYGWFYTDNNGYAQHGEINAMTFTQYSTLSYSHSNIENQDMDAAILTLSSALVKNSLTAMKQDLSPIGITPKSLMFLFF